MSSDIKIKPASIWKRVFANSIDTIFALIIIYTVSIFQEESPPPTGMSFYTQQQFENYFILVVVACLFVIFNGFMMIYSPFKKTIGQLFTQISLIGLDGSVIETKQIISRVIRTLGSVLFVCLPGPIIALLIALIVGGIFALPFSTGNQMIIDAGIPDWVRYTLHGISYLALFFAAWFIIVQPLTKILLGLKDGITSRDRATKSTYVDI